MARLRRLHANWYTLLSIERTMAAKAVGTAVWDAETKTARLIVPKSKHIKVWATAGCG